MRRLVSSLMLGLLACHRGHEPEPALLTVARTCVPVEASAQVRTVSARGVVEIAPGAHALVASQAIGHVVSLKVREGQRVTRGEVLAEVDARQVSDSAQQAEAALAAAEVGVQNARISAERAARLLDAGIASRQEVDDAQARLRSAEAASWGAKATLEVSRRAVTFATVRSPLEGVVLRALRGPGDLVDGTPATPIVDVGDPSQLNLLINVTPAQLIALALDQHGEALFDALPGKSWPVLVFSVSPAVDPVTGLGQARLRFDAAPVMPPIGLAGEARVEVSAPTEVLTVPETALRGSASGGFEVLRCEGGLAHLAEVQVGERFGARVEIIEGLDAGTTIVSADVLGLDDGVTLESAR
jgi:RND family efflux transporter MFP subunit